MASLADAFESGVVAGNPPAHSKLATVFQKDIDPLLSAEYVLGTLTPADNDPLYNLIEVSPDVSGSGQGSSYMNV